MNIDWQAFLLTTQLAGLTVVILLLVATPLARWLAHSRRAWVGWVEALVALPLVLPPTVMGFYLLLLFAPDSGPGAWWFSLTGEPLNFSFTGLVIASAIYSLPGREREEGVGGSVETAMSVRVGLVPVRRASVCSRPSR